MAAPSTKTPAADSLGVALSSLCAVHCLAGALLIGSPAVATLLGNERLELLLLIGALLVALVAVGPAYRQHRSPVPAAFVLAALVPLGLGRLEALEPSWLEAGLSVSGALLLVTGHVLNVKATRSHRACCADGGGQAAA
jgi:hypothetical protein